MAQNRDTALTKPLDPLGDDASAGVAVDAGKYRNVHVSTRPNWFHLCVALTLTATAFLIGGILCCLVILFAV